MKTTCTQNLLAVAHMFVPALVTTLSYDKLVANVDGSVDLYFGTTAPAGKESN